MKSRTVITLGLAVASLATPVSPARAQDDARTASALPVSGLAAIVREATAPYRDVQVAEAAGYVPVTPCVTGSEEGAMGIHYGNLDLIADGILDAQTPEILMYERTQPGGLRLVGVEYLVLADAWNADNDGPAALEGHLFHFTNSPNRYRLPGFYALHVWAWKHNSKGTYVDWNPHVSCDYVVGAPAS